ncbi:MAG: FtsX-like permease family protein, partial [Tannerellaceae bacterium]
NGITLFIWIIGIGTLMAGIVGVSNIMLITVRERTREFGIRKAIGATPFSILKLIIVESILITAIFGYVGMILGIGLTEGINMVMETMQAGQSSGEEDMSIFRNPTVSLGIALSATGLLVMAGVLAGYFPARKAVKITAIEAMRTE